MSPRAATPWPQKSSPVEALAQWMGEAQPALSLPQGFLDRHQRRDALALWLSGNPEFSAKEGFLKEHPQWGEAQWAEASKELWDTWMTLDLAMGAPGLLAGINKAFSRVLEAARPPGEELVFWQASAGALDHGVALFAEGAFPLSAYERTILRAPFPPFMGDPSPAEREALFCSRFLAQLNGERARPAQRPVQSNAENWGLAALVSNDRSAQAALAQTEFPGARAAMLTAGACRPLPFAVDEPSERQERALRQAQTRFEADFQRAANWLAQSLGPQEPIAMRVVPLVCAEEREALASELRFGAVSVARQARLAAAVELCALKQVVHQPARAASATRPATWSRHPAGRL